MSWQSGILYKLILLPEIAGRIEALLLHTPPAASAKPVKNSSLGKVAGWIDATSMVRGGSSARTGHARKMLSTIGPAAANGPAKAKRDLQVEVNLCLVMI